MFEINDEYVREVSTAYWEEEEEMKMGIHPLQILESTTYAQRVWMWWRNYFYGLLYFRESSYCFSE